MAQLDLGSVVQHVHGTGREAAMLARLTLELPGWLRAPISFDEARERVRRGLATRDLRFPRVVERAIYDHPTSPYLKLLRHAGCEQGDFQRLLAQEGIEGTLAVLAQQGVYVTYDEFKGRRKIVRGSTRFSATERDFDNPLVRPHWVVYTSGTRGRPGMVLRWLPLLDEITAGTGATLEAHGVAGARHVFWLTNPIAQMLNSTKLGQQTIGWLHPLRPLPARARLGARYFALAGRLAGIRLPSPRFLDVQQAPLLVTWLARRPRDGRPLVLNTMPSSAVRVAIAARAAGIDLDGVTFHLQGEPVTEARRDHLVASGARVIANYGSIEAPTAANSCATSRQADDVHVFGDRFAVIERERLVTASGPSVNALLITSLTERAGKICLNTELGEYARLERRPCDCDLGALGLTTHLSEIRSFEKLSGEGVSFARSNLLLLLEEVLPARFGGTALDYQLVEEEAPDGTAQLVLRVSPSVGPVDEAKVRGLVLAELGSDGIVDWSHAELLRRAGSVVISREPPLATAAGKVLPFHLTRATMAGRGASAP